MFFLQQLGRGLCTSKGKEYLNVLDFIGNYEKAGQAQLLLSGGKDFGERYAHDYYQIEYPDDCIVDFDMRLIDLFKEMDKKWLSAKERIKQEFYRVKEFLNEIHDLSVDEEEVYSGIGREFLSLIETTDMQKVYKMPILYSFYNEGSVRLKVTDDEVLEEYYRRRYVGEI